MTTRLTVLTPRSVAIHCSCGSRPEALLDVMSLSARAQIACLCGRIYFVRSGIGGITAHLADELWDHAREVKASRPELHGEDEQATK